MEIRITGLDALLKRLSGSKAYAKPWREAMERATLFVLGKAQENAPVDTGRLRSSLTSTLDSRPVPLFGEVGTNVLYAKPLEMSEVPHYRRGARAGQQTKGWFSGALFGSRDAIDRILRAAAKQIEKMWR